jgi:hypothetical protein
MSGHASAYALEKPQFDAAGSPNGLGRGVVHGRWSIGTKVRKFGPR